jgi:hypothetical protein
VTASPGTHGGWSTAGSKSFRSPGGAQRGGPASSEQVEHLAVVLAVDDDSRAGVVEVAVVQLDGRDVTGCLLNKTWRTAMRLFLADGWSIVDNNAV